MNSRGLRFLSFWSINDELKTEPLRAQLDELKAAGLDGVIFHPRFYPNRPAYMSEAYLDIVSDLVLYAKSIGMEFWLYDENGWPSGTAGGEVLARRPDSTYKWVKGTETANGEMRISFGSKFAVSSFDSETTRLFIDITHEGYRKGLKPEAFDYVTGFFADEVAFLDGHGITVKTGALPWNDRFPEMYEERYGEALFPLLPLLFKEGDGFERVRARFWEMLTDALVEGFYKPIGEWCAAHGKRFTAHLKGEENPFFQLSYSGSCFRVLKGVETPAIDALERYPGNNFYPRIAHSVAVQQGRNGCLAEAMGGSGWGVSPESFANYILWLAGHGIGEFVLHLNQFRLKTQAIQDWPPSMPSHLTWKEAFPELLASVKEKASRLPDLRAEPDALVVTPTRGVAALFDPADAGQMNEHDGSSVPDSASGRISNRFVELVERLHAEGIHYELSEERAIEEDGRIEDGKLWIGRRAYRSVLVPEGCRWNDPEQERRLRDAGIRVLGGDDWRAAFGGRRGAIVPASAEASAPAPAAPAPVIPEQSEWACEAPRTNRLSVEFEARPEGSLGAEYELAQPVRIGSLTLVLHDPVASASVNGQELGLTEEGGRFAARVPDELLAGQTKLSVRVVPAPGGEPRPAAFLLGSFAARSLSPFAEKDGRQWKTEGPFALAPIGEIEAGNWIVSGFPFAGEPATARKTATLAEPIGGGRRALQLTGIEAAAAYVRVGETGLGWCWGPEWTVGLPEGLPPGEHEIAVDLYPSTFNVYGPHRHIDGDRHLTSPAQYAGEKNFADRPDAPERTLGKDWHFAKWELTGPVRIVSLDGE
ncbi:hypothetical protein [Cohnella algarum]|uniref:hypothetical protein n=1 Tax=Cohnella algarum TaxID=2044859 RepID=UPI001966F2FF|nr:hypothetical protein [Cohnella algarum]MBN2983172.1 hypothetical protein [Cohnella algarum]